MLHRVERLARCLTAISKRSRDNINGASILYNASAVGGFDAASRCNVSMRELGDATNELCNVWASFFRERGVGRKIYRIFLRLRFSYT